MKSPDRVRVDLGERSYDILVGQGLLEAAGALIAPRLRQPDLVVITDRHVAAAGHLETVKQSLEAAAVGVRTIVVEPGEGAKSYAGLNDLLDRVLDLGIERGTGVVALGGGVIGDLAGFAAAILLRGLDLIQLPTTLLAQVDSAIGGKTGINTAHGKNLVGAFHQPKLVLADVAALASLPAREIRAGYAEVLKYALIDRPDFFSWLEAHRASLLAGDPAALAHAVVESCRAKASIVAADEREGGLRALLNLGHTFAHALELETGYGDELLHGEAVACGLVLAFELSARLGLCPEADALRVRRHVAAAGLPTSPRAIRAQGFDSERLLQALQRDKKVAAGRPRFVLVRGIGRAFAGAEVAMAEVRAIFDAPER